jgi:hypothetical protein
MRLWIYNVLSQQKNLWWYRMMFWNKTTVEILGMHSQILPISIRLRCVDNSLKHKSKRCQYRRRHSLFLAIERESRLPLHKWPPSFFSGYHQSFKTLYPRLDHLAINLLAKSINMALRPEASSEVKVIGSKAHFYDGKVRIYIRSRERRRWRSDIYTGREGS